MTFTVFLHLAALLALSFVFPGANAASLQQVYNWGSNPSNIQMFTYVPDNRPSNPPIVVALHFCGGSAQAYYSYARFPQYADQNGFILIYPSTNHDSNCWDVHSPQSLTHGAGGDSAGIVSMVDYVVRTYGADSSRVFVVGSSSGAMMTNNMAGTYPDVFAAGASFSGWPYGCNAGRASSSPSDPDHSCPNGQVIKSGAEWADLVHRAYPGYTGPYPRMLIAHGTADWLVTFPCYGEQMKQWSYLHNVTLTRTVSNTPTGGWYSDVYGDGTQVVGYVQQNGGHVTPMQEEIVLRFFGII